ncbi:MAG TPA: hypothetical protein VFJ96_04615 [Gemmatimonadaceae bacterium]|nr:hypothetical protein [Gemmatimonadaceae bacterium]
MSHRPRSLQHEYELYVEREIEEYKESLPRHVLLSLGDEAVKSLAAQQQLALTEILLCAEVDRIVRDRLRLPSYSTWRRRRLKAIKEFSRPERWGLHPDSALARTASAASESGGHVLLAGTHAEGPALYLAANGCAVTAIESTEDVLERVLDAATQVGLTGQIRGLVADLGSWAPDTPLTAVVCAAAALATLSPAERARAIALLQNATAAGGVHVMETGADGVQLVSIEELQQSYDGWQISVERGSTSMQTFLARKAVA